MRAAWFLYILVVVVIAIQPVVAGGGDECGPAPCGGGAVGGANGLWSLSGGVSLTQGTPETHLGSRVDALWGNQIIASWCSTTGKQLKMPHPGICYMAGLDFTGIRNIVCEGVELTPDDGITCWRAAKVAGKGWRVVIPVDWIRKCGTGAFTLGAYGLKWKVTSRDKENRLVIIFIPINWTSNRSSEVLNQVLIQEAPSYLYTKEDWALYLQTCCGFDSVIDIPSPEFFARKQAQDQLRAQLPPPVRESAVADDPPVKQAVDPLAREDRPLESPAEAGKLARVDPPKPKLVVRPEPVAPPSYEERDEPKAVPTTIYLRAGTKRLTISVPLEPVRNGDVLVFTRGKSVLMKAKVTSHINDEIYTTLTSGNATTLRRGDHISVEGR